MIKTSFHLFLLIKTTEKIKIFTCPSLIKKVNPKKKAALTPTYQYSSRIFVFKIAKTFTIFSFLNKILQNHSKSVKKTRAFLKKIYGLNKKTLECIFFARGEHSTPMSGGQHRRLTQRSTTARVRSLFFLDFSLKKRIKSRF